MLVESFIFLLLFLQLSAASPPSSSEANSNSEYSIRLNSHNNNNNRYQDNVSSSTNSAPRRTTSHAHRWPKPNPTTTPETPVDELLVNTVNGQIRGRPMVMNEHFKEINPSNATAMKQARKLYRLNAWLGIPYAEKPIGDLRFKRPVPVKPWYPNVINATHLPNSCYQLLDTVINNFVGVEMWNANTKVSEDCLYLNVWSTSPKPRNAPVLVWIYGGGFNSGTSTLNIYDPRIIVAETDLIFVSLQYRVSIFGFLYMQNEGAPGNQGLLDQYLALQWIHNNIQYFGGDSSKITIFGESSGSVSVSLHLLSPLSSNLFNNAIMQSGTALADWAVLEGTEAIKRNSEILASLGCNQTRVEDVLECAKKVDAHTAIEKSDEHFFTKANHGVAQFTFLPVIDNYFLEDEPINLLNRGKFKKCPVLLGANKDEGNWFFVYAFPEYRNLSGGPIIDYETFKDFVTSLFYFYPQYPSTSSSAILNSIIYRYTHWQNVHNSQKNLENLDDAAGDFHFVCPVVDFANIYAMNRQDVYMYYYTQRSSRHPWPDWLGVMHGDEISFVFGEPLYTDLNYTYGEKVLTRKILKYWSNFVRYSNPNGPSQDSSFSASSSSVELDEDMRSGLRRFNNLEEYVRLPNRATQTMIQPIEYWPKYRITFNPKEDSQRAHIVLNSNGVSIDHNLRSEYCAFWGSFIPSLILSESRCPCVSCLNNVERLAASASSSASSIYSNGIIVTLIIMIINYL